MLVGDWANVIIWMGMWGIILLCFAVAARLAVGIEMIPNRALALRQRSLPGWAVGIEILHAQEVKEAYTVTAWLGSVD